MSTTDTNGIPAMSPSDMGTVHLAPDGTFLGRTPLTADEADAAWDAHARLHPDRAPTTFGEALCLLAATRRLLAEECRKRLVSQATLDAIEPTAIAMAKRYGDEEIETGDRPAASTVLIAFLHTMRKVGAPC